MKTKKGWLILVLALISTALLAFYWLGCGSLNATDVSQALAKTLTDNLTINNGTTINTAPPTGNTDGGYPQIASLSGNTTLSAGQAINVNLTTNFTNTIQGAIMYVDNTHGQAASNYIKINQTASSGTQVENPNLSDSEETKVNLNITQLGSGKSMTITGSLPSTSWLTTNTVFNIKIAMVGSDFTTGLGNYSTWTVVVNGTGGRDGGTSGDICASMGSMYYCSETKSCCSQTMPLQCYYWADGTKFLCSQGSTCTQSDAQRMITYCMTK